MGNHIILTAADDFTLDAYRADPQGKARGGLVERVHEHLG